MNTTIKPKHRFDLSAFEQQSNVAFKLTQPNNQLNVVLAIPLNQIVEDEHQPRTDFNDDDWAYFVRDVQKHGIRNPIHVRPAAADGLYQIINGARRYRASVAAALGTIPCLIQTDAMRFDDYAQILDNIKNQAMAPIDIAQFIQKRLAAGDSKSIVAEKLSVNNNYITYHLAMTEMSSVVQQAFASGKVKGAQLIYRLNKLYSASPTLAKSIIDSHDEVTNALIMSARQSLEAQTDEQKLIMVATQGVPVLAPVEVQAAHEPPATVVTLPYHNPDNEVSINARQTVPHRIKKPLLLADYLGGQACVVLLHERPTQTGLIWIKLEDTGEKIQVTAEQLKLNLLTEARGQG